MNILLIATYYTPDHGPDAALNAMLCEDLTRIGHQVTVLTTVPHYPTGQVAQGFRGRLVIRECQNGVNVIRIWVPSVDRVRLAWRMLVFAIFQLLATVVGIGHRCDVVIGGDPALEIFLPFVALSAIRRRPKIYSIQDVYPDAGIKLGIFRSRAVIALIEMMERRCRAGARYVRVISENFRDKIRARGVPDERVALICNWVDTDFIRPLPRDNLFARAWDLDRHFVVLYAGNIGLSQGLENLVEAANLLAYEPRIRFAFVGDGSGRRQLQDAAQGRGLSNVSFIPFQARARVPEVLASADVCAIVLKRGLGADSVPSKMYSILAAERPVLASIDRESETCRTIERANCGICVPPEDPQAMSDAILRLFHDDELREQLGRAGREYVVANHSRPIATAQFDRLIRSAAAAPV
jgi:colanic acid biosynthesis glycosyl transferase WcaI